MEGGVRIPLNVAKPFFIFLRNSGGGRNGRRAQNALPGYNNYEEQKKVYSKQNYKETTLEINHQDQM